MSIFAPAGAVPSNLTVPATVATVAGSTGAAVGAAAGAAAGCSAVSSFLPPHPARRTNPHATGIPRIVTQVFVFILCPLPENGNLTENPIRSEERRVGKECRCTEWRYP